MRLSRRARNHDLRFIDGRGCTTLRDPKEGKLMTSAQLEAMKEGREARNAELRAAQKSSDFVSIADVVRETGLSRNFVVGMVKRRNVGTLRLPGARRFLINLADVRRVLAEAYRPPETNGSGGD
jgi:hypothetical protein